MAWSALLMAAAGWAAANPTSNLGELCEAGLTVVQGYHCVENAHGIALSPDRARAEELALYGQAAEVRFAAHFGRVAPRYALIDWDGQAKIGEDQRALNQAGFKRTLPWLSRAAYGEALKAATAEMVNAAAATTNLSAAQKDQMLAEEMRTAERGLTRYEMDLFEAIVVPHEAGHGWFTETFWPGFAMDRLGHYGSPSPDWLDETASILLESGDSAEQRRQHFQAVYRGRNDVVMREELLNLEQFLLREHPEKAANVLSADAVSEDSGPSITVVPNDPITGPRSGALYYEQGRMFADYLLDRTGNQAIFGSIAEAFAAGSTMERWLSTHGPQNNLPSSIIALQADWEAWLVGRFGVPGRRMP